MPFLFARAGISKAAVVMNGWFRFELSAFFSAGLLDRVTVPPCAATVSLTS